MTFPAFHVPNILAFQMNEPCFHSISLGARYEPDRANLSSLRFPKFPPKKVLFGVCHRLCGYCLSTVYYQPVHSLVRQTLIQVILTIDML